MYNTLCGTVLAEDPLLSRTDCLVVATAAVCVV